MNKIYAIFIYVLVFFLAACAAIEIVRGKGTGWAFTSVMAGLAIIIYIIKLPVSRVRK